MVRAENARARSLLMDLIAHALKGENVPGSFRSSLVPCPSWSRNLTALAPRALNLVLALEVFGCCCHVHPSSRLGYLDIFTAAGLAAPLMLRTRQRLPPC